jgi:AraC-like DNA-binding protein
VNPLLAEFSKSFHEATGLPIQLHAPGAFSISQDAGIPAFCRVMAVGRKSCEKCVTSHLALQDPIGIKTRTSKCFAGLTSSAVPVVRQGEPVGFLHTGHASVNGEVGCGQPGQKCVVPGGRKPTTCSGACLELPKLSASAYEGALGLVRLFSAQLASTIIPGSEGTSYSAIEHLVRQIRNDVSHDWRLPELALAAGMHPGYFSEQFHQHTGSTLTAFLATLRVEKAKSLLEFTAHSISEVAFASGFRSISQFNRVFKSQAGFAPGQIRSDRSHDAANASPENARARRR